MSAPASRRRALFGASAALLVLGAAPAGPGKAAELDGELLEAAAAIAAIDRQLAAWDTSDKEPTDADYQAEQDDFWLFADRVRQLPARTPEGVQAKARVLRLVLKSVTSEDDAVGLHVHSLVRDLLGEG